MLQPPPASLTWSNPLNNNPLHVFNRLIEKYLIAQRRACHRLHLRGKIGVMLSGSPNHKNQMLRINRREFAALTQPAISADFSSINAFKSPVSSSINSGAPASISIQNRREACG